MKIQQLEQDLTEVDYKKGFHDRIVQSVAHRLEETGLYNIVLHNSEYSCNHGDGEIDLYARAGDRVFLFEMKSTYRTKNRIKAEKQLSRAERMVKSVDSSVRPYKFFVYGAGKIHYDLRRIE